MATTNEPRAFTGMILPLLLVGIAAGCSFAMLVGATMSDVAPAQYGMAGAGRTTVFQLSIAMAIAVAVALVARPDTPEAHLSAIRAVWVTGLVLFLGQAVVFGIFFPRSSSAKRYRSHQSPAQEELSDGSVWRPLVSRHFWLRLVPPC